MHRPQKAPWISLSILLLALLPALAFAHKDVERIVVFGDSLSDPGNTYALTGIALTPPYATLDALLIPDAPYAIGGHHFSNGPTWIEQLARSLALKGAAGPAFASGHKTNFAVGGARARETGSGIDLSSQTGLYLSRSTGSSDDDTLFVIEVGGNDVRDAIAALALDPTGTVSAEIVTGALTAISDNILSLYADGAREFLIANAPDLSLTPAIRTLDLLSPGSAMAAAIISAQFNAGLDGLISQLTAQLPGTTMSKLDIYSRLHHVVSNPDQYRLTNVSDACIMPNIAPFSCRKAKYYLFWDGIHPTRAGHAIFADLAKEVLFTETEYEEDERHSKKCREKRRDRASCHH